MKSKKQSVDVAKYTIVNRKCDGDRNIFSKRNFCVWDIMRGQDLITVGGGGGVGAKTKGGAQGLISKDRKVRWSWTGPKFTGQGKREKKGKERMGGVGRLGGAGIMKGI